RKAKPGRPPPPRGGPRPKPSSLPSLRSEPEMNLDLSPEHEQFRKVVRDFADKEIAPHAEEWDRTHTFPVDVVLAMGELGLFGLPFPEECGGSDAGCRTVCRGVAETSAAPSWLPRRPQTGRRRP